VRLGEAESHFIPMLNASNGLWGIAEAMPYHGCATGILARLWVFYF